MANRSYLLFVDEDEPHNLFCGSTELVAKSTVPLFWLALFSFADLRVYRESFLVDERVFNPPDHAGTDQGIDRDWGVLVAPVAGAVARLTSRRSTLSEVLGTAAERNLDEFLTGVASSPSRFVVLNFHQVQGIVNPVEFLDRLRAGLECLDAAECHGLDVLREFCGDYLGYEAEFDRNNAFPWLTTDSSQEESGREADDPRIWRPSLHGGDDAVLGRTLTQAGFRERTRSALTLAHIHTIGDLVARRASELLALRRFGVPELEEVRERLSTLGGWLINEEPPPMRPPSEAEKKLRELFGEDVKPRES